MDTKPTEQHHNQDKKEEHHEAKQTLYDKYNGDENVPKIVAHFYEDYVLKDPEVSKFFTQTDMKKQKAMQSSFVATALGAKKPYTGKSMKAAHKGMEINDVHFDKIIEYLGKALKDAGVTDEDIKSVAGSLETYRKDIVNV